MRVEFVDSRQMRELSYLSFEAIKPCGRYATLKPKTDLKS